MGSENIGDRTWCKVLRLVVFLRHNYFLFSHSLYNIVIFYPSDTILYLGYIDLSPFFTVGHFLLYVSLRETTCSRIDDQLSVEHFFLCVIVKGDNL